MEERNYQNEITQLTKIENYEPDEFINTIGDIKYQQQLFEKWKALGYDVSMLSGIVQNAFYTWKPEWKEEWTVLAEKRLQEFKKLTEETKMYLDRLD